MTRCNICNHKATHDYGLCSNCYRGRIALGQFHFATLVAKKEAPHAQSR